MMYLDSNNRIWKYLQKEWIAYGKIIPQPKTINNQVKVIHNNWHYYTIKIMYWYTLTLSPSVEIWKSLSFYGTKQMLKNELYDIHKKYVQKLDTFDYAGILAIDSNDKLIHKFPKRYINSSQYV